MLLLAYFIASSGIDNPHRERRANRQSEGETSTAKLHEVFCRAVASVPFHSWTFWHLRVWKMLSRAEVFCLSVHNSSRAPSEGSPFVPNSLRRPRHWYEDGIATFVVVRIGYGSYQFQNQLFGKGQFIVWEKSKVPKNMVCWTL
jgi:hypothetical protein